MRMCEFVLFGGSPLSQAGFASGPRFGTPPAVCLQAMQRQVEVQRRIKQKVGSKEFEDTIQEKIQEELERHFSLLKIEIEMKKNKLIDEFKQQRDQEERSKQELEAIIRTNQQRMQEHQQRVAQALGTQADALHHERDLLQKRQEQRLKALKGPEVDGS
ncbi:unnamed protein product [Effrenium voratum]|nr:unnamed protein product [Effrenium voratum]